MAKTTSKRGAILTGTDVLAAMQQDSFNSTTSTRSTRKPFAVGTRVVRKADGARGSVESVQSYEFDGRSTWAVAVRTDVDGEVWSGTQDTAARGAWRKQTQEELHELDTHNELVAAFAADAAANERADAMLAEVDAADAARAAKLAARAEEAAADAAGVVAYDAASARKRVENDRKDDENGNLVDTNTSLDSWHKSGQHMNGAIASCAMCVAEAAEASAKAAVLAHVAEAAAAPRKVAVVESVERHDLTAPEAPVTKLAVRAAIDKLTPAGREFMEAVGMRRFDFFDEGIVAGSGNWGENMSWQFASMSGRKPRSVSGIMSRLSVNGLWTVYLDGERSSDGNWWSLTELGAAVAQQLAKSAKPAPVVETMSVAELLSAAESELDAAAQQKQEKRAQKRTQTASRAACCDWVDCANAPTTTRELAGRMWSVCSSHA